MVAISYLRSALSIEAFWSNFRGTRPIMHNMSLRLTLFKGYAANEILFLLLRVRDLGSTCRLFVKELGEHFIVISLNNLLHSLSEVVDVPILHIVNIVPFKHHWVLNFASFVKRSELLYFLHFERFNLISFVFDDLLHGWLTAQVFHVVRSLDLSTFDRCPQ